MTWISLVCLLAISSAAFGRSVSYGGYGAAQPQVSSMNLVRDFTSQQPLLGQGSQQTGFGQQTGLGQQTGFGQQTGYGQQVGYGQQKSQGLIQSQQDDIQDQSSLQQPIQSGYGSSFVAPQMIRKPIIQADLGYGKNQIGLQQRTWASPQQLLLDQQQQLQQKIQESTIVTEADNLCRGQVAETVIPLDNGRRFVVCLDDGKGHEQFCPKGLVYHTESRRCERKLGPLENPCAAQPCLNGGQCVQTDVSSYQCQCTPGYDGKTCELDATVCQTQQPCGQSQDTKCQSFRWGAALQHVCILQNGRAYGLTASQAQANPCNGIDGTFPLAFSDKGFIMCDGESMFVESCPGGTIWDDLNKACVWPDMQGVVSFDEKSLKLQGYGQSINTLPAQRSMNTQYGGYSQIKTPINQILAQQKSSPLVQQHDRFSNFGTQQQDRLSNFGTQQQDRLSNFGTQQQDRLSNFGSQQQIQLPVQQQQQDEDEQIQTTFNVQKPLRVLQQDRVEQQQLQFPQTSSFGSQKPMIKSQMFQQPIQRQQDLMRPVQQQQQQQQQHSSGY